MDRLLDQSLILYLRFNKIYNKTHAHKFYYALSLFSADSIDFDQIYLLLKILVPKHELVYFKYKDKDAFGRKVSEIM